MKGNSSKELLVSQIKKLYETDPKIHVNVSLSRPKLNLQNVVAEIKGVYPHIFVIEENSSGYTRSHTIKYSDLLTDNIHILELENKL